MGTLTPLGQRDFERLPEMDGGYVIGFNNRSFFSVTLDSVKVDIDVPK